jgi:hypothetical protein
MQPNYVYFVLVKMMVEARRPHSAAVPRENRREGADTLFQHQLDQYKIRQNLPSKWRLVTVMFV